MAGASADAISLAQDLVTALRVTTPRQPSTLLNVRSNYSLVELRGGREGGREGGRGERGEGEGEGGGGGGGREGGERGRKERSKI